MTETVLTALGRYTKHLEALCIRSPEGIKQSPYWFSDNRYGSITSNGKVVSLGGVSGINSAALAADQKILADAFGPLLAERNIAQDRIKELEAKIVEYDKTLDLCSGC